MGFSQDQKTDKESTKIIEDRIEYLMQSLEAEEVDLTTLFDQLYFYLENPIKDMMVIHKCEYLFTKN